jgi:hypothetical protein
MCARISQRADLPSASGSTGLTSTFTPCGRFSVGAVSLTFTPVVVAIETLSLAVSRAEIWLKFTLCGLTWKNGSTSASRPSCDWPRGSFEKMLIRLAAWPRLFWVCSVAVSSILRPTGIGEPKL